MARNECDDVTWRDSTHSNKEAKPSWRIECVPTRPKCQVTGKLALCISLNGMLVYDVSLIYVCASVCVCVLRTMLPSDETEPGTQRCNCKAGTGNAQRHIAVAVCPCLGVPFLSIPPEWWALLFGFRSKPETSGTNSKKKRTRFKAQAKGLRGSRDVRMERQSSLKIGASCALLFRPVAHPSL